MPQTSYKHGHRQTKLQTGDPNSTTPVVAEHNFFDGLFVAVYVPVSLTC